MPSDPSERVALHRYEVIAEALNPRLSAADRGQIVRALAGCAHIDPAGVERAYARSTLDRWIRTYRAFGLAGLRPQPRSDVGAPRRHPQLLAEVAALRLEVPARSAAAIGDIIYARHGVRIAERTIRAHLRRRGLHRAALDADTPTFGRYEADHPNQRWITDVLVGPFVPHPRAAGSRRAKLFLLVDDHSRLLVHGWWTYEENTRAGQTALRMAIARRGVPEQLYADYADLRIMPTGRSERGRLTWGFVGVGAESIGIIRSADRRPPAPKQPKRKGAILAEPSHIRVMRAAFSEFSTPAGLAHKPRVMPTSQRRFSFSPALSTAQSA